MLHRVFGKAGLGQAVHLGRLRLAEVTVASELLSVTNVKFGVAWLARRQVLKDEQYSFFLWNQYVLRPISSVRDRARRARTSGITE